MVNDQRPAKANGRLAALTHRQVPGGGRGGGGGAEVTEAAAAASLSSSSHNGHFADESDNREQTRDESVAEKRVALSPVVTEGRQKERETLRRRGDLESH